MIMNMKLKFLHSLSNYEALYICNCNTFNAFVIIVYRCEAKIINKNNICHYNGNHLKLKIKYTFKTIYHNTIILYSDLYNNLPIIDIYTRSMDIL